MFIERSRNKVALPAGGVMADLDKSILSIPLGGSEVYQYIRELLTWEDLLSAHLRKLPIEDGKCLLFVPLEESTPAPRDLHREYPPLRNYRCECRLRAASFITDYLEQREVGIALFASAALEGDRAPLSFSTRYTLIPTSKQSFAVFPYLDHYRKSLAHVMKAFDEARPFTTLVVLTTSGQDRACEEPIARLTDHEIAALSDRTDHMVLSAFDGDSYLVWSSPSSAV